MVKQAVLDIYGLTETGGTPYFIQSPALLQLQEAAEEYMNNCSQPRYGSRVRDSIGGDHHSDYLLLTWLFVGISLPTRL